MKKSDINTKVYAEDLIKRYEKGEIDDQQLHFIANEIASDFTSAQEVELFSYLRRDCPELKDSLFGEDDAPNIGTDDEPYSAVRKGTAFRYDDDDALSF